MNREQGQLFHPSNGLGGKKEEVNATIIPLYRNSDPITSKKAAKGASKRSPSQQLIILKAFASGRGFTDEEVGTFTGLAFKPRCCYWKRCSELRAMGYIIPTGDFAKSTAGELQRICKITPKGDAYYRSLEA
jgi:hypothetical protein